MKFLNLLFAIFFIASVASCGQEGMDGAMGPKGEMGPKGDKGDDGKAILNGTSNPTAAMGKEGDFYINTNSYVMFGPKTTAGWGSGMSLLGEKGDKGEADYAFLSGTTNPTNAIGKFGDFYLNRTDKTLWFRYVQILNSPAWGEVAKLANTIQFSIKDVVIYGSSDPHRDHLLKFNLPWAVFEKSMVSVYFKFGPTWYSMPGMLTPQYKWSGLEFRSADNGTRTEVTFLKEKGNQSIVINEIRILVVEADIFRTTAKSVDFKNYYMVMQYFGLQE